MADWQTDAVTDVAPNLVRRNPYAQVVQGCNTGGFSTPVTGTAGTGDSRDRPDLKATGREVDRRWSSDWIRRRPTVVTLERSGDRGDSNGAWSCLVAGDEKNLSDVEALPLVTGNGRTVALKLVRGVGFLLWPGFYRPDSGGFELLRSQGGAWIDRGKQGLHDSRLGRARDGRSWPKMSPEVGGKSVKQQESYSSYLLLLW